MPSTPRGSPTDPYGLTQNAYRERCFREFDAAAVHYQDDYFLGTTYRSEFTTPSGTWSFVRTTPWQRSLGKYKGRVVD